MALQRIDVRNADPAAQAEAAARAALVIAGGGLVALPTETVYGVAADPRQPAQVERLLALKGRPQQQEFTHHLADIGGADVLGAVWTPRARRLAERYWPGPLTLILPAPDGRPLGLRVPAHPVTQRTIAACGASLFLTSINRSGEPPVLEPDAIAAAFGAELDLLVDAGPPPLRVASTVVRATGPALEVLREGILTRAEILDTAATRVLFVCTGNTCRSPMAAALARHFTAQRLGVPPEDVLAHGFAFASAGMHADPGAPASEEAVQALAEMAIDLTGHRSRSVDTELLGHAARIYCMTSAHLQRLIAMAPEAADKCSLLRPDGGDITDPYGCSLERYRAVRDEVAEARRARFG